MMAIRLVLHDDQTLVIGLTNQRVGEDLSAATVTEIFEEPLPINHPETKVIVKGNILSALRVRVEALTHEGFTALQERSDRDTCACGGLLEEFDINRRTTSGCIACSTLYRGSEHPYSDTVHYY